MSALPHMFVAWNFQYRSAFLLGERLLYAKGTSFKQDAIKHVLGRKQRLAMATAWLVRELHNEHDENATAVYVGAIHVGWLPRQVAARLRPDIEQLTLAVGGAPSCLVSIQKVGEHGDRAWVVKLFGPWPVDESQPFERRSGRDLGDDDRDDDP